MMVLLKLSHHVALSTFARHMIRSDPSKTSTETKTSYLHLSLLLPSDTPHARREGPTKRAASINRSANQWVHADALGRQ